MSLCDRRPVHTPYGFRLRLLCNSLPLLRPGRDLLGEQARPFWCGKEASPLPIVEGQIANYNDRSIAGRRRSATSNAVKTASMDTCSTRGWYMCFLYALHPTIIQNRKICLSQVPPIIAERISAEIPMSPKRSHPDDAVEVGSVDGGR